MKNPYGMELYQTTEILDDGTFIKMVYAGPDIDGVRDFLREEFHEYNLSCHRFGLEPYTDEEIERELGTLEHAGDWDEVLSDMDPNCLIDWEYELRVAVKNMSFPCFLGERGKRVEEYAGTWN